MNKRNPIDKFARAGLVLAMGVILSGTASRAASVPLQNATATISQSGFSVANVIDGNTTAGNGWAIGGGTGANQPMVVETVSDLGFAGGTRLTFTISHFYGSGYGLGRFALYYTTDNRSTFADGLATGGDVTANWKLLAPISATSSAGATMTTNGDKSISVSGINPAQDTYTVVADTKTTGITGFRLMTLADPALPGNGPGRNSGGNFILTEFTVVAEAIVPRGTVIYIR